MYRECLSEKGGAVLRALKEMLMRQKGVLAGGTALALQIGHMRSADLDFFTGVDFTVESVISDIRNSGLPFRVQATAEQYLVAYVNDVKFSLFKYDYPFCGALTHIYKGLYMAGILDIASMKVIAISQRGVKRDFVDLFFITQDIPFHRIAENMVKRFGAERINAVHIGKSFVYFSDADAEPDPDYIAGRAVEWDAVKKFFRQHVRQFVFDIDAAISQKRRYIA